MQTWLTLSMTHSITSSCNLEPTHGSQLLVSNAIIVQIKKHKTLYE